MGNIYAPSGTPIVQNATIEYQVGGNVEAPFQWSDTGGPHPILSAVGVFDSSCAAIHIGSRNEIAARPFGLDTAPLSSLPAAAYPGCRRSDAKL